MCVLESSSVCMRACFHFNLKQIQFISKVKASGKKPKQPTNSRE